jgi:predicted alpha/beta hydrolase family esterase
LPEYTSWKREFERFDVTADTTIVAHSMGGGFVMRWLSENTEASPARVILVAPSLDPLRTNETGFCEFEIDPTITDCTKLIVMTSDNDSDKAVMSRDMITNALPATDVRMFSGYGHFIPEHTGKDTLEELVDIILE